MPVLRCYVDERTHDLLRRYSQVSGRQIEELAEAAIADAAIRSARDLPASAAVTRSAETEGLGPKADRAAREAGDAQPEQQP